MKSHDKVFARKKICFKKNNRYKTDFNFRSSCKTRIKVRKALEGKSTSISPLEILGIDNYTYKKWIKFQTTPEKYWSNTEIDHVKPICIVNVSKDEKLRECFNWKNNQSLLKEILNQKGKKFNFLDYQL